jgi:hypothetical protein
MVVPNMNSIDTSPIHEAVVILVLVVIVALAVLFALVVRRPTRAPGTADHGPTMQVWPTLHLSADGRYWWDGTDWVDADVRAPGVVARTRWSWHQRRSGPSLLIRLRPRVVHLRPGPHRMAEDLD